MGNPCCLIILRVFLSRPPSSSPGKAEERNCMQYSTQQGGPAYKPDNLRNSTGLVFRAATVSRIMRGHVMSPPFPLPNRATDVRTGCKTHRIAPTLRQVADFADEFHGSKTIVTLSDDVITHFYSNEPLWSASLLMLVPV
ncbi:hypothetical protein PoB_005653800 [Plakobranchus ocellatus]|uniref:Uncharacterized protein n=1 Tax=Plakobranchus ocellatus TaxID=259542 RepID=A0AAV4CEW9_9GAST|nr:hypothetical protein PoB_005653800 [Plakobranchus ocellatus]